MKKKVNITLIATIFVFAIVGVFKSNAQSDVGFIYGKITTERDNTYEGPIRWGKEEVFWFDIFNSSKVKNPHLKHMTWQEMEELNENSRENHINILGLKIDIDENFNYNSDHTHLFACRFGDIRSLEMDYSDRVKVELKNGKKYHVEGGSNDIGTSVRIHDSNIGLIKIKWDRIEKVEFLPTPGKLENKFGKPLFGTVETTQGEFTGFVQWDLDERVSTDELDGDASDGEVSIKFGNIRKIEKSGSGSDVFLKSGDKLYLRGSNDVNYRNKGIIVNIEKIGRVQIPWEEFESVTFDSSVKNSGKPYDEYVKASLLKGVVVTNDGDSYKGVIAYDIDELYNIETLEGIDDEIEYKIPFMYIKTVKPKNTRYSQVILRNGKSLLLGKEQDVSAKHHGILVYISKDETKYIPWEDIEKVNFY